MNKINLEKKTIFLRGFFSSASAQVISIGISFISIPITLNHLGALYFGVWMVINSILTYLSLSQFGIGTATSVLIAKNESFEVQASIFRSAFRFLLMVSIALILIVIFFAFYTDRWQLIFGSISRDEKYQAAMASIIIIIFHLIKLPITAVSSTFIGFQEVYLERIYVIILPAILMFSVLLLTIHFNGGIVMLACLTGMVQLIAGIASVIHFLIRRPNFLLKTKETINNTLDKNLLSSGSRFFIIGIAAMFVWHTDNLVISYFLGPESVSRYAITFKLFSSSFSLFVIVTSVLMPIFANAITNKEWEWLSFSYNNFLFLMNSFSGLVWLGGILFSKHIILLWTGESGYAGDMVVFSLGAYGYLLTTINLNACLLTSMNSTKAMLWFGIAEAVLNFVLSIIFVRFWGVGGVALATLASAVLTVYWLLALDVIRQTEYRVKARWNLIAQHLVTVITPSLFLAYIIKSQFNGYSFWIIGLALCVGYILFSYRLLPKEVKNFLLTFLYKHGFKLTSGVAK